MPDLNETVVTTSVVREAQLKSLRQGLRRPGWALLVASVILIGAVIRLVALDRAPTGLHFDEAVYGLLARDIYEGARPVFFASYTGREPLYMYLMALVYVFAGVTPLAIRLTSALIGIGTLGTTYLLGREWFGRRVGLLATAIIALNYWHLTVSRNGYPNILIPPLEALSLYFLTRGWRKSVHAIGRPEARGEVTTPLAIPRHAWVDYALGGLFAGLVLYTYLAARFFPVTLVALLGVMLLFQGRRVLRQWTGLVIAGLALAVVVAPLVWHFYQHPADFWERANQVLVFRRASPAEALRIYGTNILQTYAAFFVRGDPRWHYNLPLKPIYDWALGACLVLGVAVMLRHWRRLPYAATLLWVIVMAFPSLLTNELMPATQRMFGVWPALALLPAIGLDYIIRKAYAVAPSRLLLTPYALPLTLVAFFAYQAWSTLDTYFNVWTPAPEAVAIFNTDYLQMARLARAEMADGKTVVLLSEHYKHPTVIFTAPETLNAVWSMADLTLPVPARSDAPLVYLAPTSLLPPQAPQTQLLASLATSSQVDGLVTRYAVDPTRVAASGAGRGLFNGEARVLDAQLPAANRRDQPLSVGVHWAVERSVAQGRTFGIHLVDQNGVRWAQKDEMGYLTEQWQPGDQVWAWFQVPLDRTMPAGRYRVRLLLGDDNQRPLPVQDSQGRPQGLWLDLGEVAITRDGVRKTTPTNQGVAFANGLQLTQRDPLDGTVAPGVRLEIGATWQARQAITDDRPVEIVFAVDGREWAVIEQPLTSQYSPTEWSVGEINRARYVVRIPPDAPQGASQVSLRLKGDTASAPLGTVRIAGEARVFTPPPMAYPVQAQLGQRGQAIGLLAFDSPAQTYRPGDRVSLTLYWQPQTGQRDDLTVFRHLVDADGQVRVQVDSGPANGRRPTTGWVEGEVVADAAELALPPDLPPGRYRLLAGLYDATTLARLPALTKDGAAWPDNAVELGAIEIAR